MLIIVDRGHDTSHVGSMPVIIHGIRIVVDKVRPFDDFAFQVRVR